jgi:phosphate starvation-inducible PhoH-like protein
MGKRNSSFASTKTRAHDKGDRATLRRTDWHPLAEYEQQPGQRSAPRPMEPKFRQNILPQNENQQALMDAIENHDLVLALGPAGTGKTYLAVCAAVDALNAGKVSRIVLCRPAVEAGEELGFLPGDLVEKMSPYLRPLYDVLNERMGAAKVRLLMADGTIEIAPLAYMRGRTIKNAVLVIDEAQNATKKQIKMALTRLGSGAQIVMTGDPSQSDLPPGESGLAEVAEKLSVLDSVGVVYLDEQDIVRHPLVREILTVL